MGRRTNAPFASAAAATASTNLDFLVGDVFKPGVGDIFDAMGIVEPPMDEPPKAAAMA